MNPLDLRGPEFLTLYFVCGVVVCVLFGWWIRRQKAADSIPRLNLTDPYAIAFLRGGKHETLRVAAVSLVDRGLLVADGPYLAVKSSDLAGHARRPLEKAMIAAFATAGRADRIFLDSIPVDAACRGLGKDLAEKGLLATGSDYASRLPAYLLCLASLVGLAGLKVAVALSRGRHNVGFLILLAVLFTVVLTFQLFDRRTALGIRMLDDLKILFDSLRRRGGSMRTGGDTNEAALLAAVFGLSALTSDSFAFANKLFPRDTGSNSSGGSSCGSSSGGSSCGGGGGGCGGCGGGGD